MNDRRYSTTELMASVASRILEDKKSVFVGTGLPMIAALLAQRLHAPNLLIVFESGGIGPQIPTLPISVGDSRTFHRAVMATTMDYVMSLGQMGYYDFGFLGAAQIDKYGNINTTVIGDWEKPKVRLPGSGGGNDVGSFCRKTIIIMRQDKKRFVEEVDFVTTPGYLKGGESRYKAGLPRGSGPYRVITQLGVYGFNSNGEMTLVSTHPGVSIDDVIENSEFEISIPKKVESTAEPTEEELRLLREEIDPAGIVIGKRK